LPRGNLTKRAAHPGVVRLGQGLPCPNTPAVLQNDQRLLRQTFILSIDLIVFAPDARSRRSTALRFAAAGVLSRRARTRHSRSASGRMCAIFLPRACSRSFRSSESPVSALEMEVFRSVQREGSTSGFTTERSSAEPGRQTGTGDRLRPLCLLTVCACIVPSIIGDRSSRLSYTDADRSATEEKPDAADQDKDAQPTGHHPKNR
jgi:hypothetical protein